MKRQTVRTKAATIGITLACALAFTGAPASVARAVTVSGHDHYVGGPSDGGIDILSVDSADGDVVYCRVSDNGELIADRLAYRLGEDDGDPTGTGDLAGIVTARLGEVDSTHAYAIEVYADRDETQLLYEGELRAVLGRAEGVVEPVVVAWRTSSHAEDAWVRGETSEESRAFHAPETVSFGSDTLRLVSPEPVSTDPLVYDYAVDDTVGEVAAGSITYVDDRGEVVKTQEIEGIRKGQSVTVSIPEVIAVDDGYFRTTSLTRTLQASYPGARDFTITCKRLPDDLAVGQGFHTARINLVGTDGTVLATDSVLVAGTVSYSAPSRLYKGNDVVDTYAISPDQALELGEGNVLTIEPTTEGVLDGVKTYDIAYDAVHGQSEVTWTVVDVNGTVDPGSPERIIGSRGLVVSPESPTATHAPVDRLDIAGTTFVPVTKGEVSYEWNSGKDPVTWVYYVPEGHAPEEAYDVTVNYVDVATGEKIGSKTLAISPAAREDQTFVAPERIDAGADGYVRLDGQESGIRHGYYTPYRTYTVYYRGANDNLHKDTVVTKIRVEYADGEQAFASAAPGVAPAAASVAAGAQGADGSGWAGGTGGTGGAAASTASIPASDGLVTIDGAEGSPIASSEGEGLGVERIDDDTTPTQGADALGGGHARLGSVTNLVVPLVGAAVTALLAIGLVRRRGRGNGGEGPA